MNSYNEINFFDTSTCWGNWLQVGFKWTSLTFQASTLTTRPLIPLPAPLQPKGYKTRPKVLTLETTTVTFLYKEVSLPLYISQMFRSYKEINSL